MTTYDSNTNQQINKQSPRVPKNESESLLSDLDGWKIPHLSKEEKDVTELDLKQNRILFIHSELTHNEVIGVNNQFRTFLSTSKIETRKH